MRKPLALLCVISGLLFLSLLIHAKISPHAQEPSSPLTALDLQMTALQIPARPFWAVVTWLGSAVFLAAVVILAGIFLPWRQRVLLVSAGLLALILQYGLKLLIAIPRPEAALATLSTYAFPSGHTLGATAVYGMLLAIVMLSSSLSRFQNLALIVLPALILLIGFSRIALDVHWFTDVLGGLLLGLCVVSGLLLIELAAKNRGASVTARATKTGTLPRQR